MLFVSIVLAFIAAVAVIILIEATKWDMTWGKLKYDLSGTILIMVFVVSFLMIHSKLKQFEFCESAVLKICDADNTEYMR